MKKIRILWTDDEIEVLKPHILFLSEKGYEVETCSNGNDTIDLIREKNYDILFLDENMPGLSGLDTLKMIREIRNDLPVVMITKSEEEEIMEAAIGSEIAWYLIKPVKPKQVLLAVKKILDQKRLVTEKTTTDYRLEFSKISSMITTAQTFADWSELYKKIVYWEAELEKSSDQAMTGILRTQENEANQSFSRFIIKSYLSWIDGTDKNSPVLSPLLLEKKVFTRLRKGRPLFFILIDNMRFDQWRTIASELSGLLRLTEEDTFCSILPTATQFSRNAIFAGLMPAKIASAMPQYWIGEDEEEGKNNFEEELFASHLERRKLSVSWSYNKVSNSIEGRKLNEKLPGMLGKDLNIIVYNFVDILSHARTENNLIRDLSEDEPAYRSLVRSWFLHSSLFDLLKELSSRNAAVIFSTDHGAIRVQNPLRVTGDRKTTSNLRYKMGRNLDYNPAEVFEITNPDKALLPRSNITSKYIFATDRDYLVYQNNFNHYAAYYKNTFQHGGISMQEMILPVAFFEPPS
jgi:DNA-binding response OmpR family regulator